MKGQLILTITILLTFFVVSCSVEHYAMEGEPQTISNESASFAIETRIGKLIEINYDLDIENGSIMFLLQDSNNDTLLIQTHTRDLKGNYYITKSDSNDYLCNITLQSFAGSYNVSCRSK